MEAAGVIRQSNSSWASPLHQKPEGSWRPCGDYRILNTQTVPDRYPLPNVTDFTAHLHRCKIFTKLDLTKGYYQVSMAPGDIAKTAVITVNVVADALSRPDSELNFEPISTS